MTEPAENYMPVSIAKHFRGQAFKVWGVASVIVLVWLTLIVAAPIFAASGISGPAAALYKFFGFICHQMPERSFFFEGHQLAVCSRCFGVYFGLFAGMAVYPLWRSVDEIESLPRIWLFLSLVPITVDWSLTIFGIWENTHTSRFITGMILGFACATFIMPAAVEIVRNATLRRSRTV